MSMIVFALVAIAVFLVLAAILYLYYKWCFNYWIKRGVPLARNPEIPFGTFLNPLSRDLIHIGIHLQNTYSELKKRNCKHGGLMVFAFPKYIVVDREYIKNVLQKDFEYFSEREFYYNEKDDPLSANLFAISGEKWRNIRMHLSPAFTSGKMKMMFSNILACSNVMISAVMETCENKNVIDVKDVAESFTIDVIGTCGFGLECNSFKNPNAEFKREGKKAFFMTPFRIFKILLAFIFPKTARLLGITLFDTKSNDFFINVVKESIRFRQTSNVNRQDLLQLLIDLRNEQMLKSEKNVLTIEEITAQVFLFFAAGFETSSTTLTFCLYELALHPDIQNKTRDEINEILQTYNGKLTYEAIMDMKYMGQVVDETLRKYPPVSYITRRCVRDYIVPDTNTTIEKGMEVIIPIIGLHHDPEYYSDPEKFIPERFSDKEKPKKLPYTFLPFGEGPRICIGNRFGLLQTKVGLVMLLKNFKFTLNGRTDVPLKIEPYSFTLIPKSGVYLDIEKV